VKRVFVTIVLSAIVVTPWSSAVATGGAATRGGKAGSTAAMGAKGARVRHDREMVGVRGFGGFHGFGSVSFDDQSFLIVDAAPVEAQIFLDGRLLGSAADLLARALPLAPGGHTAQVIAPGYTPYVARFAADPGFSTRLRVTLPYE
jgi:PEGA domain